MQLNIINRKSVENSMKGRISVSQRRKVPKGWFPTWFPITPEENKFDIRKKTGKPLRLYISSCARVFAK